MYWQRENFLFLQKKARTKDTVHRWQYLLVLLTLLHTKFKKGFWGWLNLLSLKKQRTCMIPSCNCWKQKGLDSSLIRFSGLDGTNAMRGKRKALQLLIRHTSPYAQYLNFKNHRLALCLVHLIPKYQKLTELDGLLISLCKTFKCSSMKQSISEEAQMQQDLKPLKITKACVTRWRK